MNAKKAKATRRAVRDELALHGITPEPEQYVAKKVNRTTALHRAGSLSWFHKRMKRRVQEA